ncbi:MAG: hypothetical protein ACF8PN_04415 [Phycisphaerales bacterium]
MRSKNMMLIAAMASAVSMFGCAMQPTTPEPNVDEMATTASENEVKVDFEEVSAWEDRMPRIIDEDELNNRPPVPPRHLVLDFAATNRASESRELVVEQVLWSFEDHQLGTEAPTVTIMDEDGRETGRRSIKLDAGATNVQFKLRGRDVFPAGHGDENLWVTVTFRVGDDRFSVRRSGRVVLAM